MKFSITVIDSGSRVKFSTPVMTVLLYTGAQFSFHSVILSFAAHMYTSPERHYLQLLMDSKFTGYLLLSSSQPALSNPSNNSARDLKPGPQGQLLPHGLCNYKYKFGARAIKMPSWMQVAKNI